MTKRLLTSLLLALACSTVSAQMTEVTPAASDEPIFNPGMGLYHQYPPLNLSDDHWSHKLVNIAYIRYDWSLVNPEEGVYRFDEVIGKFYDTWYVKRGRRIAFRIMSQNTNSNRPFVTPEFVFKKGVPGVTHVSLSGVRQTDPVFWNDQYLDELDRFMAALGKWCASRRDGIEFIDLGGIGEWGEMHLQRWTPQQFAETGYTHTKYVQAYRRMIDSYCRHLSGIRLFLNVGGPNNHTINDYAALKGIHFRQDGLKHNGASYNCGEWLFRPYAQKGIICNYEFHSGYNAMQQKGWSLPQSIDVVLSQPISYLNTNLGLYGKDTPQEVKDQMLRVARKIGYRLRPASVKFFPTVTNGSDKTIPVSSIWTNDGLANPSFSFALRWSLHDQQDNVVADTLSFPRTPTTSWAPGCQESTDSDIELPKNLPAGTYTLKLKMLIPETGETIQLALPNPDADGRYAIAPINVVPPQHSLPLTVFQSAFTSADDLWRPTIDNFNVALSPDQGLNGTSCLRITGFKRNKAWNYVHKPLDIAWKPWSTYKLTAMVKVNTLAPKQSKGPYFKFELSQPGTGAWIDNVTGGRYDLALGGWQQLEVILKLDGQPVKAFAALETGGYHLLLDDIDILIDDVKIDLIAEP